ncbi:fimbrial protein [Burkholderia gladioli]|uniref:fimbrial protein n=1 Tax=Burkholderia gladioli TaxID=28095 RepID=UPI0009B79800|nr:fimbrial protein [Burkholderia gladioli]
MPRKKITFFQMKIVPLLSALVALILGFWGHTAFAAYYCTGTSQTVSIAMPTAVTITTDMQVGTLLTSWVSSAATNNYLHCNLGTNKQVLGFGFRPISISQKTDTTVKNSMVFSPGTTTVWETNLAGIGIAVAVKPISDLSNCSSSRFSDIGKPTASQAPWVGPFCNSTGSFDIGGQVQVALVKTGAIQPGVVSMGAIAEGKEYVASTSDSSNPISISFAITSTTINVAGCTTPDVKVDMHSYQQSIFKGVGSSTSPVSFSVKVNSCPSGFQSIGYQFNPTSQVVDAANGVIALTPDSTASGIGLKITDANDKPLLYNSTYSLSEYNTSTGGSYTIPLKASYYQISPTVNPGSANAAIVYILNYN